MARRHHLAYLASAAAAAAFSCALIGVAPAPAQAVTIDDLALSYQAATLSYDNAVGEQKRNDKDIKAVKTEIKAAEKKLAESKDNLAQSAVAMYKHERNRSGALDMIFQSRSLTDAIRDLEYYTRIEQYWTETVEGVKRERTELGNRKDKLEQKRELIAQEIEESEKAIASAKAALEDADHSDGAKYHQKQGNGSNCGATAFTVGLNILLHEERYPDNVAVWSGPGFRGDSTHSLAFKGTSWLMAHDLAEEFTCEEVPGDIHSTEQLKSELEQGSVVIISSGPGSIWQRADGTDTGTGMFPDGHWIVFYYYKDGVFYANDSSVGAKKGAGCPFTTDEMQQWLNGRGNHFATVLSKRHFG